MKPATAERLAEAYTFLRRVEHRIQYLDDQQTHLLPERRRRPGLDRAPPGPDLRRRRLRAARPPGRDARVRGHRVRRAAARRPGAAPAAVQRRLQNLRRRRRWPVDSEAFLDRLPAALAERVRPLGRTSRGSRRCATRASCAWRGWCSAPRQAWTTGRCSAEAALRFIDWIEPLLRRESYLALLVERPEVLQRLLRLLGLARWPMRYLMRHPGVIDELADRAPAARAASTAPPSLAELDERHAAWQRSGEADEEALLDTLRRAHHAEVFRTLVRDVEGHITRRAGGRRPVGAGRRGARLHVALGLGALAASATATAPQFAVIAYGKLGGKELGYGSDLDVVFVYDDDDEPDADKAAEVYGAFVRKLITWLTLRTAAGELFDIDTALRPNGNSGLLVTSIASFERYQRGRGSNTAWTWEHQALTRARFCAGHACTGRALRGRAPRRAGCAARPRRAARSRCRRCATRCAPPGRCRAACSTSSTAPAA